MASLFMVPSTTQDNFVPGWTNPGCFFEVEAPALPPRRAAILRDSTCASELFYSWGPGVIRTIPHPGRLNIWLVPPPLVLWPFSGSGSTSLAWLWRMYSSFRTFRRKTLEIFLTQAIPIMMRRQVGVKLEVATAGW